MLYVLISYVSGEIYSSAVDSKWKIFFSWQFYLFSKFLPEICWKEVDKWIFFHISLCFKCLTWGLNCGLPLSTRLWRVSSKYHHDTANYSINLGIVITSAYLSCCGQSVQEIAQRVFSWKRSCSQAAAYFTLILPSISYNAFRRGTTYLIN